MRTLLPTPAAASGALASLALLLALAPPAAAAGTHDITADVLVGRDVTLLGDSVVTVPPGTTTYDGVLRGEGTPTVRGDGNDVVLTPASAHPSATPRRAGDTSDTPPPRTRGALGWWPYVLAAGLLGALLVPSSLRVRGPAGRGSGGRRGGGRRGGGRHSAAG
ncbi:hypothetical protein ACIA8J_08460 [Streptomyces asoensis]|uniref:hypothetical protein n=1 Tax=Streptomyces asoensis TaxID=249586 RepID=UPI003794B818